MGIGHGFPCTSGGSNNIMVKKLKKKKLDVPSRAGGGSSESPKRRLERSEEIKRGETKGGITNVTELPEKERRKEVRRSKGLRPNVGIAAGEAEMPGEQITITAEEPPQTLNPLDILAAPLSKPGTFFTEGPIAGGLAVKESRQKIREGDFGEAGSVILTTATTTGLLAGALLAGSGAVGTVTALNAKLAATTGLEAATAATIATKAGLTGGVGLGLIFGIDKFVFSPAELGTWAAVDNVAGALSFQISELDNGVRAGSTTPEEAAIIIAETESTINIMRNYVTTQAERNPKLWASSKIFNEALDTAEARVQQISLQIFGAQG